VIKPNDIAPTAGLPEPPPPESTLATLGDLATIKQNIRKMERARLRGTFTPTGGGPNRKARRAARG